MKFAKQAAAIVGIWVVVIVVVVLVRTQRFGGGSEPMVTVRQSSSTRDAVDSGAIKRLSDAIKIPTISYLDSAPRIPEFKKLHALFEKSFPLVHARLRREVIDGGTLLYTWGGSDTTLAPVLLMGHQDVVPVEPGTEKEWKHGAFSGDVADGEVWGRGTMDDKISVLGTLEAAEALLKRGFVPRRSVIFAFGHTEEVGGPSAARTAQLLQQRGIHPLFVMDEGGAMGKELVPGVDQNVALIGISEKGYLSLRLTAHGANGHSSMPPPETAVSILGGAVDRVQKDQLPAHLSPATVGMFNAVGPLMSYSRRMVFANLWLFTGLLESQMSKVPSGNSVVRTTTAATMFSAGVKDNVVPSTATAVINFRLMPGDSVAWVMRRVKQTVNDSRVDVDTIAGTAREASQTSPTDSEGYTMIASTIVEVFGDTHVAPFMLGGGTDSRNFYLVTPNVYRFAPIAVTGDGLKLVHGTNERVSLASYLDGVRFYTRLLETAAR